jgi:tetratricopeptide (TPR) repeat protein
MSSIRIPIKRVGGFGRAHLKLEGTVLIFNEKHWCYETTLLIPIETIETSELSRFYKDLAILAIAVPIIATTIGLFGYFFALRGEDELRGTLIILFGTILLVTILLEIVLLFGLMMNFLFTKKTICLTTTNNTVEIEFWKQRKIVEKIDDLIRQIKEQQALLKENQVHQSEDVFEISDINQIPSLFLKSCFFCIPALIIEKPLLLLLALIPSALYIWRNVIKLRQHPKEFRQALASYKRKDWERAIKYLKNLLEYSPENIPAMSMLAETYVRAEQFDKAISITAQISEEYLDERNALHLQIWKFKRIHLRRKEDNLGNDKHESQQENFNNRKL